MRQGRAHLGDGIGQAEIHDGDDDGAEEHATPAAYGEAEVPAGEIARDDRGDAERPQIKNARVAPELAVLEIIYAGTAIGNAAFVLFLSHFSNPRHCAGSLGSQAAWA